MIYTPLTNRAMQIAYHAHHGQTDKGGIPYIFHPIHLAEQMADEYTTCIALLHDVMEDTTVGYDDLSAEFPPEVMEALELLTHKEEIPYLAYIENIKTNPLARTVKLADLMHNTDRTRLPLNDPSAQRRRDEKYRKALEILTKED